MNKSNFFLFLILVLLVSACAPVPTPPGAPTPTASQAATEPTATSGVEPSPTPGRNLVVNSEQDNGPGTLRQALQDAQPGDMITFDTAVFPPDNPQTIQLLSGLPTLRRGGITLDASNAGVILDGSQAGGEWQAGLDVQSANNVIRGLEIANFTGPGILLRENATQNIIGGSRSRGSGPFGQGNLIRNTSDGIALRGSENHILGNLIGTDPTGKEKWGNRNPGIFIENGASRNVIGPENIIAYNGQDAGGGVEIRSLAAQGNHITQNNIHDNASSAILYNLSEGGETAIPQPPLLLDFDLAQGAVSGIACPGCTVEFFTSAESGEVFEGSVLAEANGNFHFQKSGPFAGTSLKATSYSDGQNNSEFSIPMNAPARSLAFQKENAFPRASLPTEKFENLPFNGVGTMQYIGCDNPQFASDYAMRAVRMGYKWMRVSADWYDWPEIVNRGEYSDYTITPCQDAAISALAENGIQMLYTIVYWDPEIQVTNGYTRFRSQAEIDRYLAYVRFIVGHFKDRIHWYSILNEPNLSDGQRAVRVEDYINLVRQVIPVIKEIDPHAKVVIGEVTPLNEEGSLTYLKTILNSEVLPLADGLAWHGSSGNSLDYQPEFYRSYPAWVDEIVATARKNGFQGQFFATELHWRTANTPQPIGDRFWYYSNAVAGKYYARGMTLNLSKGFWITVGSENYESIPEAIQVIASLTHVLAGAQPESLEVNFANPSPELRSVAFSLPDGSRLVAIWRDVKAVDDDPGIENTLLLPGIQAEKVIGIDPLYAYQQELVFTRDGGLSIPGILVHDYPTFVLFR